MLVCTLKLEKKINAKIVHMINKGNRSIFFIRYFICRRPAAPFCCGFFCSFYVFLLNYLAMINFVTTNFDKIQNQSEQRLCQIKAVVSLRLRTKIIEFFIVCYSRIVFLFVWYRRLLGFFLQDYQKKQKMVGTEKCSTCSMKKVC